jgi:dihydrofolate reductase
MRKLIARVFDYSLDGVIATEGTEFFQFCRDLPEDPAEDARGSEFYAGADLHIMGRVAYQSMAGYFPSATDDPNADALNAGRKVVFSRTLTVADWANTTIASGDLGREVGRLRQGGDGYIVVHGGISLWRSLARLDLIDEYRLTLVPYLADEGPRLFEDAGKSRQLDLLSSTAFSSGLQLDYRVRRTALQRGDGEGKDQVVDHLGGEAGVGKLAEDEQVVDDQRGEDRDKEIEVAALGDLAPGHGPFEDLPEADAAPSQELLADDLAELRVAGQRSDQAEHQLGVEPDIGAVGAFRQGVQVAAQRSGVGYLARLAQRGDRVDHELGLARPAAVDRHLARLGPGRHRVDAQAVVSDLGQQFERGVTERGVTGGVQLAAPVRGGCLVGFLARGSVHDSSSARSAGCRFVGQHPTAPGCE